MIVRTGPRPPLGRRIARRLLLSSASLLVALVLFLMLEFALQIVGLGAIDPGRAALLPSQHFDRPLLRPARGQGEAGLLATADARLPYQTLPATRQDGALRVVCVGGSATAGLGFSPNAAFPRALEAMLAQALPGHPVDVLNLGLAALASRQVRWFVKEACETHDPDLVVVHAGHHEFLDPLARARTPAAGGLSGALLGALSETHLFRLAASLGGLRTAPERFDEADGTELPLTGGPSLASDSLTPEEIEEVLERYRRNLHAMVLAAREAGVPVVLMTLAGNRHGASAGAGRNGTALTQDLEALNARLSRVADHHDLELLDTAAALSSPGADEALARESFYDEVHFTPGGALRVAAALFERMGTLGLLPADTPFDPQAHLAHRLDELSARTEDFVSAERWLGVGDDMGRIADPSPWKYDRMLVDLEEHLTEHPNDPRALAWKANAQAFRADGAEAALADYTRAAELQPGLPGLEENMLQVRARLGGDHP